MTDREERPMLRDVRGGSIANLGVSVASTSQFVAGTDSIQIENVSKAYQRSDGQQIQALAPTKLSLRAGEFLGLIGPSGCGKTTLLNIIAGLLAPTEGQVTIHGRPVTKPDPAMSMVFQKPTLLRWLTVMENILLPTRVAHKSLKSARLRAAHLLDVAGLSEFADRYPSELSGGMQQRAAVVRALTGAPSVLLMDEPFSALDEFTREHLNDELLRLWEEEMQTVVFVTHNISEAVYLSDRIGVMTPRPGRLQSVLDIDFGRPRSEKLRSDPQFHHACTRVRAMIGQY